MELIGKNKNKKISLISEIKNYIKNINIDENKKSRNYSYDSLLNQLSALNISEKLLNDAHSKQTYIENNKRTENTNTNKINYIKETEIKINDNINQYVEIVTESIKNNTPYKIKYKKKFIYIRR